MKAGRPGQAGDVATARGIDGCRAGWVVASVDAGGALRVELARDVAAALSDAGPGIALIDMPIGLPDACPREAERLARACLGRPRASSVFAVPCRAAVYADDYASACAINRAALGKAISRQAWNICPRIRELDAWLRAAGNDATRVLEGHPELCFWALGGARAMIHGKKTLAGRRERLAVLAHHAPAARDAYRRALRRWPRSAVARDDVIDAMVLAISANGLPLGRLPGGRAPRDAAGLAMQINYPQPAGWSPPQVR